VHHKTETRSEIVADELSGDGARRLILGSAALMVIIQLAFRAWALYPSWFYLDDYNLLSDAQGHRLDIGYLLEPYNSHLMPAGRLVAWWVADSGSLDWRAAATSMLVLQAAAGAGAVWMLVTLFGARWAILGPLGLYLSSAISLPAMMWWTAGLNQVFLQCAFFLAVGAWVRYLRSRRLRWLALTTLAVVAGLAFYVKALLILPVLAYLVLAYFATGGPLRRLGSVLRLYWPAIVTGGAVGAAYVTYYISHVPQPLTVTTAELTAQIADSMIGTAFVSAVVGGPWRWDALAPPNAFADPPEWTVHLAWVAVALIVAYAALHRSGTFRAWGLLTTYLGGLLYLLVSSRAPVYGAIIGQEYRYLTDAAAALALSVGLAFLELPGAAGSSRPRIRPRLTIRLPPAAITILVALVCASSVVSSSLYVRIWHTQNASDAYLHSLRSSLRAAGEVDLADTDVPDAVIPGIFAPANTVSGLVPLVSGLASFPDVSPRLGTVGPDGLLRRTLIQPGVVSQDGPREGCGWLVTGRARTIPLAGRAFDWVWWVRIGYLASRDGVVDIVAGDTRVVTDVSSGVHDVYLKVSGSFDRVLVHVRGHDARLCIDTIEVGQPVPGGFW
jgi:hypothetical protein